MIILIGDGLLFYVCMQNLLVTTTLTMSSDPYPLDTAQVLNEEKEEMEKTELQSNPEENGVEPMAVDKDEGVMAELKEDMDNEMMLDVPTFEDMVSRQVDPVPGQTDEL